MVFADAWWFPTLRHLNWITHATIRSWHPHHHLLSGFCLVIRSQNRTVHDSSWDWEEHLLVVISKIFLYTGMLPLAKLTTKTGYIFCFYRSILGWFQSSWCIATCRNQPPKIHENSIGGHPTLAFALALAFAFAWWTENRHFGSSMMFNGISFCWSELWIHPLVLMGNLLVQGFPVGGMRSFSNLRGSWKSFPYYKTLVIVNGKCQYKCQFHALVV